MKAKKEGAMLPHRDDVGVIGEPSSVRSRLDQRTTRRFNRLLTEFGSPRRAPEFRSRSVSARAAYNTNNHLNIC